MRSARAYGSSRPPARVYGGVHHTPSSPLHTLLCAAGSGAVVVRSLCTCPAPTPSHTADPPPPLPAHRCSP